MTPLLEVTDPEDLDDIGLYQAVGDFVMVEVPEYLTERANKYSAPVTEVLDRYGNQTAFYLDRTDRIDIPVVSGSIDPVDYAEYLQRYNALVESFNRIALRLMIKEPSEGLDPSERARLRELATTVGGRDIVLVDVLDAYVGGPLVRDLKWLTELFDVSMVGVLNVFDAYDEFPENKTPEMADAAGASAFGDFVINQRFKPDGGGSPETVKHRHYHPIDAEVEFFSGDDYGEVADELTGWDDWDRAHCDACRRADRTTNTDPNTWAQIKMHHYLASVLHRDHLPGGSRRRLTY